MLKFLRQEDHRFRPLGREKPGGASVDWGRQCHQGYQLKASSIDIEMFAASSTLEQLHTNRWVGFVVRG